MPIPRLLEHKIGVFVSERATIPRFCPLSSTKSGIGVFVLGKSNRGEGEREESSQRARKAKGKSNRVEGVERKGEREP